MALKSSCLRGSTEQWLSKSSHTFAGLMAKSRLRFASFGGAVGAPGHADRANVDAFSEFRSKFRLDHLGFDFGANFGSILRDQNEPANGSLYIRLIYKA